MPGLRCSLLCYFSGLALPVFHQHRTENKTTAIGNRVRNSETADGPRGMHGPSAGREVLRVSIATADVESSPQLAVPSHVDDVKAVFVFR